MVIDTIIITLVYFVAVSVGMSFLTTCSLGYWLLLALSYVVIVGLEAYALRQVIARQEQDPDDVLPGDVNFKDNPLSRPLIAFLMGTWLCLLWRNETRRSRSLCLTIYTVL